MRIVRENLKLGMGRSPARLISCRPQRLGKGALCSRAIPETSQMLPEHTLSKRVDSRMAARQIHLSSEQFIQNRDPLLQVTRGSLEIPCQSSEMECVLLTQDRIFALETIDIQERLLVPSEQIKTPEQSQKTIPNPRR